MALRPRPLHTGTMDDRHTVPLNVAIVTFGYKQAAGMKLLRRGGNEERKLKIIIVIIIVRRSIEQQTKHTTKTQGHRVHRHPQVLG